MSFPSVPNYSKNQINRAGELLTTTGPNSKSYRDSLKVVNAWRVAHAYPLNTFNSTLRDKVRRFKEPIVAQRLKRLPTIIDKLTRYPQMKLVRMQDIGGIRGIVNTIKEVQTLQIEYKDSKRFSHILSRMDDYISHPKNDGYRGVHLVYKYNNTLARNGLASEYKGLMVELQLRTKLQHTWATAVETMGTFRGEEFKSGQGNKEWRDFFAITSSAFAHVEKTPPIPQFAHLNAEETVKKLAEMEEKLHVLEQIRGLAIAANAIETKGIGGFYNLIILNQEHKRVEIRAYKRDQLFSAAKDLASLEAEQSKGAKIDPVLVSAGRLKSLKKAYPNYFLDSTDFIKKIEILVKEAKGTV